MTKRLYVVRDSLAQTIVGGLLMFAHDAAAVRMFGDAASDPQTAINRHPADHDLLCIGEIEEETGFCRAIGPDHIVNAATLLNLRNEASKAS